MQPLPWITLAALYFMHRDEEFIGGYKTHLTEAYNDCPLAQYVVVSIRNYRMRMVGYRTLSDVVYALHAILTSDSEGLYGAYFVAPQRLEPLTVSIGFTGHDENGIAKLYEETMEILDKGGDYGLGSKILAIKKVHTATNLGLKASKELVEERPTLTRFTEVVQGHMR